MIAVVSLSRLYCALLSLNQSISLLSSVAGNVAVSIVKKGKV
jgi:hypothetical protein